MYKKIFRAFLIVISIFFIYFLVRTTDLGALQSNQNSANSKSENLQFRSLKNDAYYYGERLEYSVMYSFLKAGTGYFHILPRPVYHNNRECYDIRFQVNSLKSLEWIYKVSDAYQTALDIEGLFPWEFKQKMREGGYKKDYKATFDQINNYAITSDKKFKVPEYVHDIVSAFYYVRTLDISSMPKGSILKLQNFFDDSTWSLGVKYLGKQTIEVRAGKFRCIVIEPLVTEGGLFKSEGKILIWLTDDENKIPVKVSTKILNGSVAAELDKYSGLKNPAKAKIYDN